MRPSLLATHCDPTYQPSPKKYSGENLEKQNYNVVKKSLY
jgi:hypothetical protein